MCAWVLPVVYVLKYSGHPIVRRHANTDVKKVRHLFYPLINQWTNVLFTQKWWHIYMTKIYWNLNLEKSLFFLQLLIYLDIKCLCSVKVVNLKCIRRLWTRVARLWHVHTIIDDIIVYVRSQVEHDWCLENVVKVLFEKTFSLNKDQCQLNMAQTVFVGHVSSVGT